MSMQGTHKARAREWNINKINGKERITISFELVGGPFAGQRILYDGYFTDATWERTFDSMRHCGWDSADAGDPTGLDRNEVELVIEPEEYNGQLRDKVKWVNKLGGVSQRDALNPAEAQSFSERFKARALAHKATYGGPKAQGANGRQPPAGLEQQRREAQQLANEPDPF